MIIRVSDASTQVLEDVIWSSFKNKYSKTEEIVKWMNFKDVVRDGPHPMPDSDGCGPLRVKAIRTQNWAVASNSQILNPLTFY